MNVFAAFPSQTPTPRCLIASRRLFVNKSLAALALAFFGVAALAAAAPAQSLTARDHLTAQEADLIRDEPRLDRRMDIFVKAIERRMVRLGAPKSFGNAPQQTTAANAKQPTTDNEKLGVIPASTHAELLSDIARILEEASTNIDDAGERGRQKELLPKALRKLSDAASRHLTPLIAMRDTADEVTRLALERAIENAQAIIEAVAQPEPSAK